MTLIIDRMAVMRSLLACLIICHSMFSLPGIASCGRFAIDVELSPHGLRAPYPAEIAPTFEPRDVFSFVGPVALPPFQLTEEIRNGRIAALSVVCLLPTPFPSRHSSLPRPPPEA